MSESDIHSWLVWLMVAAGAGSAIALTILSAPYGRHARAGWGPTLDARWGWALMESPAVLVFIGVYLAGDQGSNAAPLALLALWQIHYVHRTFIFPLRMPAGGKRMPISVAAMAFVFNIWNAYINARWISELGSYEDSWLAQPAFIIGALIFACGFVLNIHSDRILFTLKRNSPDYAIPRGGLFRFVSCPNYLGEIVEWIGWAIAAWSPAGLAFAFFTAANLVPRALTHHRWYRERFPDYPRDRKALIPFIL